VYLNSNMMKLWIATMTEKLLAWTKFKQWAAVAKMEPAIKNTLIRTSFEELKTSICWLKSIIQVEDYRKKDAAITDIMWITDILSITEFVWTTDSVWRENWLYMTRDTLTLQRIILKKTTHKWVWSLIRITARDCSDENFNDEGLFWWEL